MAAPKLRRRRNDTARSQWRKPCLTDLFERQVHFLPIHFERYTLIEHGQQSAREPAPPVARRFQLDKYSGADETFEMRARAQHPIVARR
jgi:hypothetical protein